MAKNNFEVEIRVRRHWFDEPRTKYEKHCIKEAEKKYEGYFRRASEEELDPEIVEDVLHGVIGRMDRIIGRRSTRKSCAEWLVLHTLAMVLRDVLEDLDPVRKEDL